jgi:thiol-disulfide isomerase/thioredoxin
MKKLFVIAIYLFCIHCASSKSDSIYLYGTVNSEITNQFDTKELLIKIFNPFDKLLNQEKIIRVSLTDRKFSIQLPATKEGLYVSFWAINQNDNEGRMYPIQFHTRKSADLDEVYFFERGDSIKVYIGKNGNMGFSGKGAEKLRLQNNLYNLPDPFLLVQDRSLELQNTERHQEALSLESAAALSSWQLRQKIIESYRPQISNHAYGVLYYDAQAYVDYQRLRWSSLAKATIKELGDSSVDSIYQAESAFYPEMLFLKEIRTYSDIPLQNYSIKDMTDLWSRLQKAYSGELLDKLVLVLIKKANSETVRPLIDQFIEGSTNTLVKSSLKKWKENMFAKTFPFELQDEKGFVHRLDDYTGKVIVMDLWFTGCGACLNLNAAMHHIMEKYRDHKDVVFITVCSDKNKKSWITSLATGKYTSPGSVNLYTNGKGFEHPILKYYNITGAPRQLIIAKDGTMVSTNPPRPDVRDKKFIPLKMDNSPESQEENAKIVMGNPNAQLFIDILETELKK